MTDVKIMNSLVQQKVATIISFIINCRTVGSVAALKLAFQSYAVRSSSFMITDIFFSMKTCYEKQMFQTSQVIEYLAKIIAMEWPTSYDELSVVFLLS